MINSEGATSIDPDVDDTALQVVKQTDVKNELPIKEQADSEKSKLLLSELNDLEVGDAKINFLLDNDSANWNTIVDFGSNKAMELVNLFLSKLDPKEKSPTELAKLVKLPVKNSFLVFGFISDLVRETENPKYISEILKKGFETGGKSLSALMLSTVLFEQVASKLKSEQSAELIIDIMQGQEESASLSSFIFSGLIKSFTKDIFSRMDRRSGFKLLDTMASRLKDKKLDFGSFPVNGLLFKLDANEIKQLSADQILALSESNMSFDQKELILNKFFAGEGKKSIFRRWTAENQRQLFRTLLRKHFGEFKQVFVLKNKTDSIQDHGWIGLFYGAMKTAGTSISMRTASLGS